MFIKRRMKNQRMAEGNLVKVSAVTTANHSRHRDAPVAIMPQDGGITRPDTVIAETQQSETVIRMNVDTGVIEHKVWFRHQILKPRQCLSEYGHIPNIIDMAFDLDIKIAGRLSRRIVRLAMHRAGEDVRTFGKDACRAIALMNITIEYQNRSRRTLLDQSGGAVGEIIEHAISGTMGEMGVVRTAGGMAGKTEFKSLTRRQQRAVYRKE